MQQHVRITTYDLKDGSFSELSDLAQQGMMRVLSEHPGFIRCGLADLGDRTLVSVSLWETRIQAEAAMPAAEGWLREHVGDRVGLRATQSGELAFFGGTPATV